MGTIRLLWVEPPRGVRAIEAEADRSLLDRRAIEPRAAAGFPGPTGSYGLLPEECWRTMEPQDPAPVFLHESYEAVLEKWVNSLPDAAAEVSIVARVRDAVMQLVETRLAADPAAISVSPTVTTTEPTPQGMAVVGRCVVLRPARGLRRSAPETTPGRISPSG
ncbi:hypothetical protein [Geodermatophilus sp. URMC 64]